uniref:cDNA FLJ26702 fis, clone PCD01871 n=1 Tax=Homo sapiens TaxID=9606 RepID=Q6ZP20_HUMAN|nr:unnamed protein product [Homo sapiens]
MPVIPELWEAKADRSSEVRSSRPACQHGETPSLLKIQKLAGHGGTCWLSQLFGRLRQENHLNPGGGSCSELRSCHCTPAWATEQASVSKKKKKKKKKEKKEIDLKALHVEAITKFSSQVWVFINQKDMTRRLC